MSHRYLYLLGLALLFIIFPTSAAAPGETGESPQQPPAPPWEGLHFDLIIRSGDVLDGTGTPPFRADIGIRGNRIVFIGDLTGAPSDKTFDATGLTVAPGFIDAHSHTYETILDNPDALTDLAQGITTVVGGVDGRSPLDLPDYFDKVASKGSGVNHALFVGQGSLRLKVMGKKTGPLRPSWNK